MAVAASNTFSLLDICGGKNDDATETAVAASPYMTRDCIPLESLVDSDGVVSDSSESTLLTGDISMTGA